MLSPKGFFYLYQVTVFLFSGKRRM